MSNENNSSEFITENELINMYSDIFSPGEEILIAGKCAAGEIQTESGHCCKNSNNTNCYLP